MRRKSRGQAAVETAIVMPLFVFILLGLIQLGLLHQARLLTKYAAYKAVRAGALNRGDMRTMKNAAIAVMLPLMSQDGAIATGNARRQPQYAVYNVSDPYSYEDAYDDVISGQSNRAFGKPMVDVTICAPLRGAANIDFDDPKNNPNDWKGFDTTKLAIQVTMYQVMYIPYANAFIWWAARGEEGTGRVQTMKALRMKKTRVQDQARFSPNNSWTLRQLNNEAEQGNYIMPIRASYTLRMQSNFKPNANIPRTNECHIPWLKK